MRVVRLMNGVAGRSARVLAGLALIAGGIAAGGAGGLVLALIGVVPLAAGACLAAPLVRETVGSEATNPNTAGSARTTAMSARQSPPSPRATARSSSTFAGSWMANGLRHGASGADSAASRPDARIVAVSSAPPAHETTPLPAPSTRTRGV
jgi:hypothetical protein